MGSRRLFTHFLRAKGIMWPQKPSLSVGVLAAGAAGGVEDGCCDIAARGALRITRGLLRDCRDNQSRSQQNYSALAGEQTRVA